MAVCLTGPHRHLGGIRIFYSLSILWNSDLSSIRVKWILLTRTLGSRDHFHPEGPLLPMIACCTRRFRRYSLMFFWELVLIGFAFPYHRGIPMGSYLYLPPLPSFSITLVTTRYPELLPAIPRILRAYCLAALFCTITLTHKFSHLSRISSFLVVFVFHKILQGTIRFSENP